MNSKKYYYSPRLRVDALGMLLMQQPQSQTDITDDPATEPAMAPERGEDLVPECEETVWGKLW